jgi:hypothetical protein
MALHFQEPLGERLISTFRAGSGFGAYHRGVSRPPLDVSHQALAVAPNIPEQLRRFVVSRRSGHRY